MDRPANRASLRDVAERAGVSIKTVSNVVHDYAHVSAVTRERVKAALEELNYRPNVSARNLRRGRSGVIALAVPELDLPYFAELTRVVIEAADRHGWTVLVDQTDGLPAREQLVVDGIRDQLIDGLIFSPLTENRETLVSRREQTPMVLLGERAFDGSADHVAIDNVAAAREATEHLLACGRRRIAAIGYQPRPRDATGRLRYRGYVAALEAAGYAVDQSLVMRTEGYHRADGCSAVQQLLSGGEPPDALFCFNDLMAMGAIRALHEAGLRTPEDVCVVGFDDNEDGRYSIPTLTTVRPDKEQIATVAVELLAARIAGTAPPGPQEVVARHDLVVRESTAGGRRIDSSAVDAHRDGHE